ncbi:reticulocyte-binding protein homolog 2a-like protein [Lates japonicus]|uniref:Reticulocyte-binding protein homolog 2a-like protein n=1 Tax=Lates japonicus TaxID=270547 RepID=A0AAD3MFL3_LATJO|nr:reticulocyte-binding protein homolog 2a-like protein [Lates japonicus]
MATTLMRSMAAVLLWPMGPSSDGSRLPRQQADSLHRELESQIKSHKDTVSQNELLVQNLRDEQDALLQENVQEIELVQKDTAEKELILQKELEELITLLNDQLSRNLELSMELKAESEEKQKLEEKKEDKPADMDEKETSKQESLSDALPDPKPKKIEMSETMRATNTSAWKRARHFLGLRKAKRWKKSAVPASTSST